jgi:hypothetical protein
LGWGKTKVERVGGVRGIRGRAGLRVSEQLRRNGVW